MNKPTKLGVAAIPKLEQALKHEDPEIRGVRAPAALEQISANLKKEAKEQFPERSVADAMKSLENTKSARDLVALDKLTSADPATAKARLEDIERLSSGLPD